MERPRLLPAALAGGPASFNLNRFEGQGADIGQILSSAMMLPMMALTEDAREGFAAFNAKRQPAWPGR